jgi:hypothetical protein
MLRFKERDCAALLTSDSACEVMVLSNNTMERTGNHRGRIVLAMDRVLADAQWQWLPAAQLGR